MAGRRVMVHGPKSAWRYALAGGVLGLGSPLGLLLLRFGRSFDRDLSGWLRLELSGMWGIYLYAGLATVFFFALFGYLLGKRNAQLSRISEKLENESRHLEKLSITDGLTQLYVHNYMLVRLREEWSRARRYGAPLACLFIDIDGFKDHNDAYGHLFGDAVLKRIADLLKLNVRGSDLLGRFGGDEFLAILPEADAQKAYHVAERIRLAVQNMSLQASGMDVHVTVSIGIFASRSLPESSREVIHFADRALRAAKKKGKNQSLLFAGPEPAEDVGDQAENLALPR